MDIVFEQITEPLHDEESVVNCGRVPVAPVLTVALSSLFAARLVMQTAGHESGHSQELEVVFGHEVLDLVLFGHSDIEIEFGEKWSVFVVEFHHVVVGAVAFASARVDLAEAALTYGHT